MENDLVFMNQFGKLSDEECSKLKTCVFGYQ
jgi:hypothetical protein